MAENSNKEGKSVYENTNGFPMANGKNLHMEVNIFNINSFKFRLDVVMLQIG